MAAIEVPIDQLIPQAWPIVMVDQLLDFTDDLSVEAGLLVTEDNLFYTPQGNLAAPGVVEHMAQTIALYTGYQYHLRNEPAPTGYIGAIKSIEILRLPKLNESLISKAEILHEIMGVTSVRVTTRSAGEVIATSEMKTVIAP